MRLRDFFICHPRPWGARLLFLELWRELQLDRFWKERFPDTREGTSSVHVLTVLCAYRLISPGSEWRLHREWFEKSALADLLGEDFREVLPGNTADKTTLKMFLEKIETLYGKARRIWVMDRSIPTEEVLAQMRQSDPPIFYIVATPKGRLSRLESKLVDQPWQEIREGVQVKLLPESGERYILAQSLDRVNKERAMRRRQLKLLWHRLQALGQMKKLTRDKLLLKLGAAQQQSPSAWRLVAMRLPKAGEDSNTGSRRTFS